MLEIKIDLVPFGREEGRKTIGSVFIANVGTLQDAGTDKLCRYHAWLSVPSHMLNWSIGAATGLCT